MTDFEKIQALDEIEREEEIRCFEALKDAKTTADIAAANDHLFADDDFVQVAAFSLCGSLLDRCDELEELSIKQQYDERYSIIDTMAEIVGTLNSVKAAIRAGRLKGKRSGINFNLVCRPTRLYYPIADNLHERISVLRSKVVGVWNWLQPASYRLQKRGKAAAKNLADIVLIGSADPKDVLYSSQTCQTLVPKALRLEAARRILEKNPEKIAGQPLDEEAAYALEQLAKLIFETESRENSGSYANDVPKLICAHLQKYVMAANYCTRFCENLFFQLSGMAEWMAAHELESCINNKFSKIYYHKKINAEILSGLIFDILIRSNSI